MGFGIARRRAGACAATGRDGMGWRTVDQSVHGADFFQADYDARTRTWEVTFSLPSDTPATRHLRLHLGE